jgi:hypothetical protein
MSELAEPKYKVRVKVVGNDGNAFAIMGAVLAALRKAGATKEEQTAYANDAMSEDYGHLLRVSGKWVDLV